MGQQGEKDRRGARGKVVQVGWKQGSKEGEDEGREEREVGERGEDKGLEEKEKKVVSLTYCHPSHPIRSGTLCKV